MEPKWSNKNKPLKFISWSMDPFQYMMLSTIEYVIISLSLSLVLAKFFPAIHNRIVSRITKLEHQSLYWGTVIVFNVLTYGMLYQAGRGWCLTLLYDQYMMAQWFDIRWRSIIASIFVIQEVVVNVILLFGALIASLRNCGITSVLIPNGIAKIIINISFLITCFCCCVGCSPQRKAKTLRVLVMFSFMSFIYHSVMDIIAVTFLIFIQKSRASVITITLLYISLLIFLVLFASYSLLILFRANYSNISHLNQCLTCFGGAFLFFTLFSALILMILTNIIIVFSLNLQGVSGIVTGLVPSIALSSIAWYIKIRLVTKGHTNSSSSVPGQLQTETGANGREDERMLLP